MKFNKILIILSILCLTVMPSYASTVPSTEAKLEYNKGMDFYKIGQYDKSADAFRRAIDLNPEYIDAYYNLGSICRIQLLERWLHLISWFSLLYCYYLVF